ncbi:hypothetical protein CBR_g48768 [Chara braunii]|uniref:Uncharacterized protein n=1 Tax=Chara braunii TaxID=69332 RepID=A0A388M389_CHABU|nr:hypothetical protein CBR_g48768 [Chara braunii]|eukprot:GBG89057.1 hypothetical protein CBR_g48768 [Chara braunii]
MTSVINLADLSVGANLWVSASFLVIPIVLVLNAWSLLREDLNGGRIGNVELEFSSPSKSSRHNGRSAVRNHHHHVDVHRLQMTLSALSPSSLSSSSTGSSRLEQIIVVDGGVTRVTALAGRRSTSFSHPALSRFAPAFSSSSSSSSSCSSSCASAFASKIAIPTGGCSAAPGRGSLPPLSASPSPPPPPPPCPCPPPLSPNLPLSPNSFSRSKACTDAGGGAGRAAAAGGGELQLPLFSPDLSPNPAAGGPVLSRSASLPPKPPRKQALDRDRVRLYSRSLSHPPFGRRSSLASISIAGGRGGGSSSLSRPLCRRSRCLSADVAREEAATTHRLGRDLDLWPSLVAWAKSLGRAKPAIGIRRDLSPTKPAATKSGDIESSDDDDSKRDPCDRDRERDHDHGLPEKEQADVDSVGIGTTTRHTTGTHLVPFMDEEQQALQPLLQKPGLLLPGMLASTPSAYPAAPIKRLNATLTTYGSVDLPPPPSSSSQLQVVVPTTMALPHSCPPQSPLPSPNAVSAAASMRSRLASPPAFSTDQLEEWRTIFEEEEEEEEEEEVNAVWVFWWFLHCCSDLRGGGGGGGECCVAIQSGGFFIAVQIFEEEEEEEEEEEVIF